MKISKERIAMRYKEIEQLKNSTLESISETYLQEALDLVEHLQDYIHLSLHTQPIKSVLEGVSKIVHTTTIGHLYYSELTHLTDLYINHLTLDGLMANHRRIEEQS